MIEHLSHEERVMLYVMGRLELLLARGLVGGKRRLAPKGVAWFDQLAATGFRPTEDEARSAMAAYNGTSPGAINGDLLLLVMRYDDAKHGPTEATT